MQSRAEELRELIKEAERYRRLLREQNRRRMLVSLSLLEEGRQTLRRSNAVLKRSKAWLES